MCSNSEISKSRSSLEALAKAGRSWCWRAGMSGAGVSHSTCEVRLVSQLDRVDRHSGH